MKARLSMLVLFVLVAVQAVAAQVPGAEFEEYVNKALKDWGVPGVAIAIVKDDRVVLAMEFEISLWLPEHNVSGRGPDHSLNHQQDLVLRFGPNFTGDLQHWHYDTFRVVWRDPMQGKGFVNFRLNTQGKVDVINIENLSEFTRVPEPATRTLTSVKE